MTALRWIYSGAALCLTVAALAQEPKLQQRTSPAEAKPEQNVTKTVTEVKSPLALPTDAGGEYVFGRPGEFIEIIFEDGVLHGYMSRESGSDDDRGAPLTYYFSKTTVDGTRISFTTYLIHGTWYSFEGTIVRGMAKSLADDGFYKLVGSLVLHDQAARTEQRRNVNLKLSRRM